MNWDAEDARCIATMLEDAVQRGRFKMVQPLLTGLDRDLLVALLDLLLLDLEQVRQAGE